MRLNTLLTKVLLEILIDSRMGTPAEFNADKVLEKLAKFYLVTRSLIIGNLNKL